MKRSSRNADAESPPRLISTREAARMLGVSTRTMLRMGADGTIPPPVRMGTNLLRWRLADLLAFIGGRA